MTVEMSELVPGAVFRVPKTLRTRYWDRVIPAGAKITLWHESWYKQFGVWEWRDAVVVLAEPGGSHRLRKSKLRKVVVPWEDVDVPFTMKQDAEAVIGGEPCVYAAGMNYMAYNREVLELLPAWRELDLVTVDMHSVAKALEYWHRVASKKPAIHPWWQFWRKSAPSATPQ